MVSSPLPRVRERHGGGEQDLHRKETAQMVARGISKPAMSSPRPGFIRYCMARPKVGPKIMAARAAGEWGRALVCPAADGSIWLSMTWAMSCRNPFISFLKDLDHRANPKKSRNAR